MIAIRDMSMSEIQEEFPPAMKRTVIRRIKKLHENQRIQRGIIRGKGKHLRYFIEEENTKNNLLVRAFTTKGKKIKEVRYTVKQRELSQFITQEIKFYKKELKNLKNESFSEYVSYHIAMMAHCLEWISQITWAIYSGMLGNSENKLHLAFRNKERYEEFLQIVIYNLKEKDEDTMKAVSKAMYHALLDNQLFKELTTGRGKLRIN